MHNLAAAPYLIHDVDYWECDALITFHTGGKEFQFYFSWDDVSRSPTIEDFFAFEKRNRIL